jgi:hypothetical protein
MPTSRIFLRRLSLCRICRESAATVTSGVFILSLPGSKILNVKPIYPIAARSVNHWNQPSTSASCSRQASVIKLNQDMRIIAADEGRMRREVLDRKWTGYRGGDR